MRRSGCWPGRRVARDTPGIERPANARGTARAPGGHAGKDQWTALREGDVVPRSGEVVRVTKSASVQFTQPMMFRVIRVHDWQTTDGWAWLDGYQLDSAGDAVERRSIYVQLNGL